MSRDFAFNGSGHDRVGQKVSIKTRFNTDKRPLNRCSISEFRNLVGHSSTHVRLRIGSGSRCAQGEFPEVGRKKMREFHAHGRMAISAWATGVSERRGFSDFWVRR